MAAHDETREATASEAGVDGLVKLTEGEGMAVDDWNQ